MSGVNTWTFSGNIGRDAEVRNAGGTSVAGFSVAASAGYGQRKQTIWVDCSLWGKRGEALAQHLTKGKPVTIAGELGTREHNGKTYITCEVAQVGFGGDAAGPRPVSDAEASHAKTPASKAAPADAIDEDIPF